nr:VCBS domain-containing protein [Cobetia sp. 5-11-6-3]
MTGTDDLPVISTDTGAVAEDGTPEATGTLTATDADNADLAFVAATDDSSVYGTFTVDAAGNWTYTLDNESAAVQGLTPDDTISEQYTVTLTDGTTTTVDITITGATDDAPTITMADKEVTEATGATVTDTFQVEADAGIASVTINGTDITSASVDNPIVIPGATDDEGTLTITGYDSGTVSYTYVEDGTAADHTAGDDSVFDNFAVVVTDLAGQSTSDSLDVKILDTAPKAKPDERDIDEDETAELTGNVIDGANDNEDILGADAPFMVCKLNDTGISDGGSATVTGDYGTLTLNSDGSYTYVLDTTKTQSLAEGEPAEDVFTYVLEDSDGDTSSTTLTINITGSADTVPVITLADKEVTEATGATVTDTFQVEADAGIASVTINGTDITSASVDNPIVIPGATDDEGTLTITGYDSGTVSYTYVEDGTAADHTAGDDSVVDDFAVVVTDLAGQSTTSSLDVTVLDTAPIANADTRSMNENRSAAVTGNVVDGSSATADTLRADAVTVTAVTSGSETVAVSDGAAAVITGAHGELTLEADGSYSYQSAREDLQFLAAGESVTDVYTYVIRDADGDTSSTTLTITINGRNDGPAISVNSGDSASASLTETDSALSTSGTLSVTDVDLSNSVTPSVTSVSSNGDTGALDNDDLLALLGVDTGAIIDDENTEGTLNWTFDSSAAGESFDYLSAGESLVLTYTVTVTDTAGATATQDVTITIQGTNDAPVVTATEGRVSEEGLEGGIADSDAADGFTDTTDATIVTGTVSVTDVDSDSVSLVLTAPATAITSGGSAVTWSGSGTQSMVATDAEGNEVATVTIDDSGAYTFTLSQAVDHSGDGEDVLSLDFGVLATDSEGASSTGTLTIGIEDDAPLAVDPASYSLAFVDTNLSLMLDVSGSMGTLDTTTGQSRLNSAIDSLKTLIEAYDQYGEVRVNLVIFTNTAGSLDGWATANEALSVLESLRGFRGGVTNYDAALAEMMDNFNEPGALSNGQYVSYFVSDGTPYGSDGNTETLTNSYDSSVLSVNDPDNGIGDDEEDIWTSFLSENGVKSYAVGLGTAGTDNLDPIAYDGVTGENIGSVVFDGFAQIDEYFADTVTQSIQGDVDGSSIMDGEIGLADGGYISDLTVDGESYSFDPESNEIQALAGDWSFDATTSVLTVATDLGGSLELSFRDGGFEYTAPTGLTQTEQERFDFTVADGDGDSESSYFLIDLDQQDVLIGTTGNDSLSGTDISDQVIGLAGNDTLRGLEGNDTLVGGAGSDSLEGGSGTDTLKGGDGADLLIGGTGNDILTGGDGADTFQWMSGDDVNSEGGMATDTITDFSVADGDVIDLSDLLQSNGDADALSSFLHFESDGDGGTTIEISVDGSAGSNVTQEITLQDVDLTSGGDSDAQIIQSLLDSNSLKTNVDG